MSGEEEQLDEGEHGYFARRRLRDLAIFANKVYWGGPSNASSRWQPIYQAGFPYITAQQTTTTLQ